MEDKKGLFEILSFNWKQRNITPTKGTIREDALKW